MVHNTPVLSDRTPHDRLKANNGDPWIDNGSRISRNDSENSKEKLAHAPDLKDYRLGECLGRGAFGSVYKAFNWGTGEAVAVKKIKLGDLPKSELRMIEAEIDLLKNLNNGSLHSICKSYGKFPENLVGVYMGQILLGLQYLHDQGVIHRDIKGANILTTKDGKVKLADFGVSTSTFAGADKEAQVVGTPYWMAPEIIQLSGATPASDIWSLGCTVIELLEGKPPYYKLAPMPALFAIVNDDHPPLPEGVSPAARDFLMQCFQKDPNLRVSARKLLKHAWIVGSKRIDAPVAKPPANFSEAVEEVKQWNEALRSPTSAGPLSASKRTKNTIPMFLRREHAFKNMNNEQQILGINTHNKGFLRLAQQKNHAEAFRSPDSKTDDNWDADFTSAISPSALTLPQFKPHDNFGGLLSTDRLKSFASFELANDKSDNWDHNFEGELLTIKYPGPAHDSELHELETIRPYHAGLNTYKEPVNIFRQSHYIKSQDSQELLHDDYSTTSQKENQVILSKRSPVSYQDPLADQLTQLRDEDETIFYDEAKINKIKNETSSTKFSHPSDFMRLPRSANFTASNDSNINFRLNNSKSEERDFHRKLYSVEIQKFAEDEGDEDFSDVFAHDLSIVAKDDSDRDSENGVRMLTLHSKFSSNSWLGDEDDEDDPFATLEQSFDEMDLQANIARDKHARLCTLVESLVGSLKVTEEHDLISDVSAQLLNVLSESEDAKSLIISAHGMLPILEILEPCTVKSRQSMILRLLQVVNTIIFDNVEIQENLCFVGGIPIITKFAARQYSNEIRLEAAAFVRQMYSTSTLTLQMFVSAGGLNVLVEFLDEDFDESRDLLLIGVNGIWSVFELQKNKGPTPKNDFCRIFSRSKILSPLALVLDRVLREDDDLSELVQGRIVNIFYLFSQAENYVKEVVADRVVIKRVLKDLGRMTPIHQITMLKFIKNLSMLSTTLDSLHAANAIEILIDLLSSSMKVKPAHFREISNQVLNTMYNLCRLSKVRQEDAAINGIIPLLQRIMKTDRPPKEFALPILCDLAHSGKVCRKYLWQNKGLQFYVSLLEDQYWQVTALDAIFFWLQEETAKVEKYLLEGNFIQAIVDCFKASKSCAFDNNLLEPLQKLLRLSSPISVSLSRPELFSGIQQKLNHKKAVVRLNLLRIVRSISDPSDDKSFSIKDHDLFAAIQRLAENDAAVLVRNMASELVKANLAKGVDAGGTCRPQSRQIRRTFTPPSLQVSQVPNAPSHVGQMSSPSSFMGDSITPRRMKIRDCNETTLHNARKIDEGQIQASRRAGIENLAIGASNKSRLPRTSMGLRASRFTKATQVSNEVDPPSCRKNEILPRDYHKSTAAPLPSSNESKNLKQRSKVSTEDMEWT
ncbi:Bgt-1818 [Blumeria graminis f. sp. tritici]|uniref:non-specific serine/threonine protein kinase n=2 Tax=Blumeria graminis f. sp. tritici TaxID=62690 RepID=A0A9X9MM54_BLUGR|nr:Protein kinase of the Mitotic Exit Network [Blumeria graminis f. sp. tritici 96224]VDB93124.1 Bgt-1818 [Blumeria graminis f. sp. tritici]